MVKLHSTMFTCRWHTDRPVVYFDQQTGAPPPFAGLNQFFKAKTYFCLLLRHKMYIKSKK